MGVGLFMITGCMQTIRIGFSFGLLVFVTAHLLLSVRPSLLDSPYVVAECLCEGTASGAA